MDVDIDEFVDGLYNTKLERRPALHGATDFISWTWEMVNAGHAEVGWSADGDRIVVTNPERLASVVLPQYFRHSQYASWVRALNAYNFRKARPGQWCHPMFRRGHPENLKFILRKQPGSRRGAQSGQGRSSTQLIRMPQRGPNPVGSLLQQEKARLWWMEQQLQQLEDEAQGIRDEDLEQKLNTIRIMQLMLSNVRHVKAGKDSPRLHLNPDVLGTNTHKRITFKHDGMATGGSSFTWGPWKTDSDESGRFDIGVEGDVLNSSRTAPTDDVSALLGLDLTDASDTSAAMDATSTLTDSSSPAQPKSPTTISSVLLPLVRTQQQSSPFSTTGSNALPGLDIDSSAFSSLRNGERQANALLPAEGTVERARLEQMVDFYFARLSIAADNALAHTDVA